MDEIPAEPRPLKQRIILILGSLGGIGFVPIASGTVTVAVLGIPLFYLMSGMGLWSYLAVTVLFFFFSVVISEWGDAVLGEKDSRKMVADEIAGYMVAVVALPFTWQIVLVSFLVERALDIAKVPPANWIEDHVPGGWGVVLDDVVAGLYTLALMHTLVWLLPSWVGL